jgi:hypothetical protein
VESYTLTANQKANGKSQKSKVWRSHFFMKGFRIFLLFAICLLPFAIPFYAFAAVPDGYVVKVASATVYLDWGTDSGVRAGDRFVLYRPGAELKHPVSGEVLGHEELALGEGVLDRVENKFSIGHLDQSSGTIQAGDRTRWQQARLVEAATATVAASSPSAAGLVHELWRSDPLPEEAVSITLADLSGDGQKDIVLAFHKKIEAFRWKDRRLESVASFDNPHYRHWLAVDAADLKGEGRDEIFATAFLDGLHRPHVIILRLENGAFKVVGDVEGFVRAETRLDGRRHLYLQDLSRARELSYTAAAELVWSKGAYRAGNTVDHSFFDDQLLGFTWGDFAGDGREDLAVLEHGDRVRIYGKDFKWKSNETYGGTKNSFSFDEGIAYLFPRLMRWRASPEAGAARDQLLVPHNFPELGINLAYLRLYKRGELDGLAWNGLVMSRAWQLPVDGYLADYAIGDGLHQNSPQLWLAAIGPGDKTVLVAYSLP